jgi:NodT family efflux transporter outer membrane factor (OMF) lipoprotein
MAQYLSRYLHCLFCSLLLLVCCLSCAHNPPIHPELPVPLPSSFSRTGPEPVKATWWLSFHDPELDSLINRAFSTNFTLRMAKNRLLAARSAARQAGALLTPLVTGQAKAGTRHDYTRDNSTDSFHLSLAASYEVDLWGRLAAARDAAALEAEASLADMQTAAVSIAAEIAKTWYTIVETKMQLDLLQKQHETNSRVLTLITSRFRAGLAGAPDMLQQRQLVESTTEELAVMRRTLALLEHQLSLLVGEIPGKHSFNPGDTLPHLMPLPDTGIPGDLLTRRPDIERQFHRLRAADKKVASAIADRLPRLSISAELSTTADRASRLFDNWFTNFLANLAAPLLDGGLRKEEVNRQKALAELQFYQYGQTILQAILEVENSLAREKEQREIIDSLARQLDFAQRTVHHVSIRYRQGAEDYQRVLQALLYHQKLQRNLLKAKRLQIEYRIGLYRALGGHPLEIE